VSRRSRGALAALLALLWARPALGVVVTGSVGGGYQQSSSETPNELRSANGWNWNGTMNLSRFPLNPRLLSGSASVGYGNVHTSGGGRTTAADTLTYSLTSHWLGASAYPFDLGARRSVSDFSTEGDEPRTGTNVVTSLNGGIRHALSFGPKLTAQLRRTDVEHSTSVGPSDSRSTSTLQLGATQTAPNLTYGIHYSTGWGSGDRADANSRQHSASFGGSVQVAKGVRVRFSDDYQLHVPTVSAPTSVRLESHGISAGTDVQRGERAVATHSGDYRYTRSLVEVQDVEPTESIVHGVSYGVALRPPGPWGYSANASGSVSEMHALGTDRRGAGLSTGAGVNWRGQYGKAQVLADGSASGGILVQSEEGTAGAWGTSAGTSAAYNARTWAGQASYRASFESNLNATQGTTWQQKASAAATRRLTRSIAGALRLDAVGARRSSSISGAAFSRTLSTGASLGWWRIVVDGSFAVTDSAAGLTGGFGDGLLLAPSLNTRTITENGRVTFRATRRLMLSGTVRQTTIDAPDEPTRKELGALAQADYAIGSLTVRAENRYTLTESGPDWARGNSFYMSAVRSFGIGN
jgi:hypothetical protein